MQLFLILASCKGHSPLQRLVMLTLSCLCSSNSPPLATGAGNTERKLPTGPMLETPPHIHPFLEGECLKKVARWGHLAFSKKQRV